MVVMTALFFCFFGALYSKAVKKRKKRATQKPRNLKNKGTCNRSNFGRSMLGRSLVGRSLNGRMLQSHRYHPTAVCCRDKLPWACPTTEPAAPRGVWGASGVCSRLAADSGQAARLAKLARCGIGQRPPTSSHESTQKIFGRCPVKTTQN